MKQKVRITDIPSESKTAAAIAAELEKEAKKMMKVAKILKGGRRA
jgi:hypothetical protein